MNDPRRLQASLNLASRARWDTFASHRRRVTDLLTQIADPGRTRLCVLGAGNGNDLDLPALLAAHREVHLVDLDAEALAHAAESQGVAGHPSLRRHGGVDVTARLDAIATWSPGVAVPPAEVAAIADWPAGRAARGLPGPFDLVASTCLLRPLIGHVFHAVGEHHPQFDSLVRAIRAGHLRLLTDLAAPGGAAVLITDIVSSDTLPALGSLPESDLPGLLPRLTRERNFLHGVDPADLPAAFRRDPVLRERMAGLEPSSPWRWDLGARLYLVWAMTCRLGPPACGLTGNAAGSTSARPAPGPAARP
jgi:hypothetical protein